MSKLLSFLLLAVCVVAVQMAPQAAYEDSVEELDDNSDEDWDQDWDEDLDEDWDEDSDQDWNQDSDEDWNEDWDSSDVDERVLIPWKQGWAVVKPIVVEAGKKGGKVALDKIYEKIGSNPPAARNQIVDVDARVKIPWKQGWAIVKPIIKEAGSKGGKVALDKIYEKIGSNPPAARNQVVDVDARVKIPWAKGWAVVKPIIVEAGSKGGKAALDKIYEKIGSNPPAARYQNRWASDVDARVNIPWSKGWAVVKPIIVEAGSKGGKAALDKIYEKIGSNPPGRPAVRYQLDQSSDDVDARVKIPWKQGWKIAKPILKEIGKKTAHIAVDEIIKGVHH